MAGRVSFSIAQPITIIGFWLASILLIALIAVASHAFHAPGVQDQALTQAYYYAIFAAGLYQIISYLMCVTVYGAYRGHYSKEFKLTVAQRTLMLQTIAFLVYLLLGALVFSHIEGWKFLDAVYWADFTSLTIGIGADYVPTTHLGRGLLFPFAIGGITILGLVVGSIRSLVLERGKKKMAARITEKTRAKLVRDIQTAIEKKHRSRSHGVMGLDKEHVSALGLQPGEGSISEIERREAEFLAMRRVQARADTTRKYYSLMVSTFAFAFLVRPSLLDCFSKHRKRQLICHPVDRWCIGVLQDRKEPAMDLFPVPLLCLHEFVDHRLWRFPAHQQQWQTLFCLLVIAGRSDPDHTHLRHG